MPAHVVAVHCHAGHLFSKTPVDRIGLVRGHGVRGGAHFGATAQHRPRVARDPTQPNLRQVHLLHQELLDALMAAGLPVQPGDMGENITTCGLDLLGLSAGTRLRIGASAVVEVTGLRNPCAQIENFQPGLLAAVLERRHDGSLVRKAGVMGIVVEDGMVNAGDPFTLVHQPARFQALQPV